MVQLVYESVDNGQIFPVNIFVAPIENSTFHWHNEYEVIGILKGCISVHVEQKTVVLRERDLFLINSRVIHAIRNGESGYNLCMILQMAPGLFHLGKNEENDIRFYLDSTDTEEIPECGLDYFYKKFAALVYESLKEERHSPFRIRALVSGMIADLFDNVVYDVRLRDPVEQMQQELAVDLIRHLEQHLEEENVIKLVCRKFGLSRKSLDRNLKTATGVTGKEIMEKLRVEKAKRLLKNTDKNMNVILDSCGFGSEKTFYRVFRRETGLTPNEFRRQGQLEGYDEKLKGYLDYEVSEVKFILEKILDERRGEQEADGSDF